MLVFQIVTLPAWSLPEDGVVVGGDATIHEPDGSSLTITQHSNRAVIDWQSFSVGRGEHARFDLPSKNSVTVNRVVGDDVSKIFGALSSNGKMVLINRHGIHIGPEAHIDVAGFLATTADISNEDAMSGNYNFQWAGDSRGYILNEGTITAAEGGLIGLVAPWVENRGTLEATLGKVVIAAGDTFTLDLYGDQLVELAISDEHAERIFGVEASGHIDAAGGEVILMTASAAGAAVGSVLNIDGLVEAQSIAEVDGRIVLLGGDNSSATIAGTLDASGYDDGERGGVVEVSADTIALEETARVDVSGALGGGIAHIGGGVQGKGDLPTAQSLMIAEGAEIRADATKTGNGGEVVLWADGETDFAGWVSARAARGGRGGFVEVSGRETLNYRGEVRVGAGGTLLLDPLELVVDEILAEQLRIGLIDGATMELMATESVTIASTIDGRALGGGTPGGGIVIKTETGPVLIDADIITNDGAIDITSGGNLVMASDLGDVTSGNGVVVFVSNGSDGLGTAPVTMLSNGIANLQFIATAGTVDVTAKQNILINKRIDAGGDGASFTSAGGSVTIDANVVARNSRILVDAQNGVTMNPGGGLFVSNGSTSLGNGLIALTSEGLMTLGPLATAGGVDITTNGVITLDGRIDAGADGVSVVSTGNSIAVNADIVTQNGEIVLGANGSLVMSPAGGDISGDAVSLIVADGPSDLGTATVDLDSGQEMGLQYVATRGAVTANAGGALTLNQDLGTLDNAASSLELIGSSVTLPDNVITENGNITVAATSGTITTIPDSAILVGDGGGDQNPGDGIVKLSFTEGTLDVENVITSGAIDIDYLGPDGIVGTVNINQQLGSADAPVGGLDINAPIVDQKAEIVAAGKVALGKANVGTTTLRRNVFTGGGDFEVRNDTILDPRREFLDLNGDPLMFDQLIGLDELGNVLSEQTAVTEVHQLAEPAEDEFMVFLNDESGIYFTEVPIGQLVTENSSYDGLFPNLRQNVVTNQTGAGELGEYVESTWTLTIDTTSANGDQSGTIDFLGNVNLPDEMRSIVDGPTNQDSRETGIDTTQYTGLLSPCEVDFCGGARVDVREFGFNRDKELGEFGDGPTGLSKRAVNVFGTFEFVELVLDAGDKVVGFGGNVGMRNPGVTDGTENTVYLNIESAGGVRIADGRRLLINSLRIPEGLIDVPDSGFRDLATPQLEDGHYFIAHGRNRGLQAEELFRASGNRLSLIIDPNAGEPNSENIGEIVPRIRKNTLPTTGTFTSAPAGGSTFESSTMFSYGGGGMGLFDGTSTLGANTSTTGSPPGLGPAGDAPATPSTPSSSGGGTTLAGTGSESSTTAVDDIDSSEADGESSDESEVASMWDCPQGDAGSSKLTPAEAAFTPDARGGPYSVDSFCERFAIVAIATDAPADYSTLSAAAGDYWTDAAQARTDHVLPELAPGFGVTEATGAGK
jgi:filamentous hemagglutinin family protein